VPVAIGVHARDRAGREQRDEPEGGDEGARAGPLKSGR